MGVDLPRTFPGELDLDYEEEDSDKVWNFIERNPYASLIHRIFNSFTNVYGFYSAYVFDLMFTYDDELEPAGENIPFCLLDLAASKLPAEELQGLVDKSKFQEFKYRVRKQYEKWLSEVKEKAFRTDVPLKAELLQMVYGSDEELGVEAEKESLGLGSTVRLHPDVYMNELLRGMRIIHQVLPAIMKKFGMGADEFTVDGSQLYISSCAEGRKDQKQDE
jgi:hypothetical protein